MQPTGREVRGFVQLIESKWGVSLRPETRKAVEREVGRLMEQGGNPTETVARLGVFLKDLQLANKKDQSIDQPVEDVEDREAAGRVDVGGTSAEQARVDAAADALARHLNADPRVAEMRRSILGQDEPVSRRKAWGLLKPHLVNVAFGVRDQSIVRCLDDKGRPAVFKTAPPLDRLKDWAKNLTMLFGWTEAESAHFLLTGEGPRRRAVEALVGQTLSQTMSGRVTNVRTKSGRVSEARIVLTVYPNVSPESVADTFEAAQRRLYGVLRGRFSLRRMAVLQFVEERTDLQGNHPKYETMAGEWNRTAARRKAEWRDRGERSWEYDDWRDFWRDHDGAMKRRERAKVVN